MRRFLAIWLILLTHNAWADVVVQVLDQNQKPVPNTVISLPNHPVKTPDTTAIMDQINIQFSPHVLIIQKGQYVSFPNSDNIRHHVYSFSKPKVFEIKLYRGTATNPILFNKAGLEVLGCNIHDDMIGYIYIADNEFAVKTDKDGKATLPAKAGDQIEIWNENLASTINTKKTMVLNSSTTETITLDLLPSATDSTTVDNVNPGFGKKF